MRQNSNWIIGQVIVAWTSIKVRFHSWLSQFSSLNNMRQLKPRFPFSLTQVLSCSRNSSHKSLVVCRKFRCLVHRHRQSVVLSVVVVDTVGDVGTSIIVLCVWQRASHVENATSSIISHHTVRKNARHMSNPGSLLTVSDSSPDVYYLSEVCGNTGAWFIDLPVENVNVKFKIDLGADFSLITVETCSWILSCHFIAIREFKLALQSGNGQFRSKSTI